MFTRNIKFLMQEHNTFSYLHLKFFIKKYH